MKKYRVGFKWNNGQEDYIVIESDRNSSEIAEDFKNADKTQKLELVYVKPLN